MSRWTSLVQDSVPLSHHVWREETECSARFGPLTQFVVSRMTLKSLAKLLSKPWDLGVVPACSSTKHQLGIGIIIFKCDWKGKKWNHQPVGEKKHRNSTTILHHVAFICSQSSNWEAFPEFHSHFHRIGWWKKINRKALYIYLLVKTHGFRCLIFP